MQPLLCAKPLRITSHSARVGMTSRRSLSAPQHCALRGSTLLLDPTVGPRALLVADPHDITRDERICVCSP
jgi:hypothetical protein